MLGATAICLVVCEPLVPELTRGAARSRKWREERDCCGEIENDGVIHKREHTRTNTAHDHLELFLC